MAGVGQLWGLFCPSPMKTFSTAVPCNRVMSYPRMDSRQTPCLVKGVRRKLLRQPGMRVIENQQGLLTQDTRRLYKNLSRASTLAGG